MEKQFNTKGTKVTKVKTSNIRPFFPLEYFVSFVVNFFRLSVSIDLNPLAGKKVT